MNLGEKIEVPQGNSNVGEQKSIKQFFKASDLKNEQKIEGIYKGTFQSKKTEGYHFHIFEDKQGDVYAYGESIVLNDKIETIKKAQAANDVMLYCTFSYLGKEKNKKNPKTTSHKFSQIEFVKTDVPKPTPKFDGAAEALDDIPF